MAGFAGNIAQNQMRMKQQGLGQAGGSSPKFSGDAGQQHGATYYETAGDAGLQSLSNYWKNKTNSGGSDIDNQISDVQNQMNYWTQPTKLTQRSGGPQGEYYDPFSGNWTGQNTAQITSGLQTRLQGLNAQKFRSNIPQLENNIYGQVAERGNQQLNNQFGMINQKNSSRGLLYGGINEGQKQNARADMGGFLAGQRSSINSQVEGAANSADMQAISDAQRQQQFSQQINNSIYENAMAQMAGENNIAGQALGAVGAVAGAYFGGGVGAAAGYQAGNKIGSGRS